MPVALQAECKDMTVAAISLARAGALHSIGNVTSRASCSMQRLLCQPNVVPYDALVLAHASSLLEGDVPCACCAHGGCGFVPGMVMDFVFEYVAETRLEGSGEGVSDCSRAVVLAGWVVTGSE